ncbi:MAG: lyase [Acidobacteria bacterium]|nr:lyase [Acidobacteriota bacterium]
MTRFRALVAAALVVALSISLAPLLRGQGATKVDVQFTDWDALTPTARPHDPAFGIDGTTLWYTGQGAHTLGRVDMNTGQVREFDLPGRHGPHGLVSDRDGNIWYTGNAAGLIGKLDPRTGQVTEFKMPDPAARDPHTPIFDRNGILWFTVQGGNFVGKLDPKTGAVTLKAAPPRGRPYGIVIMSNGTPVFDLFGTNRIGTIDPKTMEITEYTLPEGARPRRIAVDANDIVWYTDFARGYLGRLDLKTRDVKEFPSPAGAQAQPYGISATADGAIWYSESGVQPNTLVRFDPATSTFQKWNIPSGGGVVRHMVTAPNGDLLLAYSGVNKVGRVRIRKTT